MDHPQVGQLDLTGSFGSFPAFPTGPLQADYCLWRKVAADPNQSFNLPFQHVRLSRKCSLDGPRANTWRGWHTFIQQSLHAWVHVEIRLEGGALRLLALKVRRVRWRVIPCQ